MRIEINSDNPKWYDLLLVPVFIILILAAFVLGGFGAATFYMLRTAPHYEKHLQTPEDTIGNKKINKR